MSFRDLNDSSSDEDIGKVKKKSNSGGVNDYGAVWGPRRVTRSMSRGVVADEEDRNLPSVSREERVDRPNATAGQRKPYSSIASKANNLSATKNYVNVQLPCHETYMKKAENFEKTIQHFHRSLKSIDDEITQFFKGNQ